MVNIERLELVLRYVEGLFVKNGHFNLNLNFLDHITLGLVQLVQGIEDVRYMFDWAVEGEAVA